MPSKDDGEENNQKRIDMIKVDKLYDVHEKPHISNSPYGVRRIIIKSAKVVSSR